VRVRVQVIVEGDDETPPAVHEVAHIERSDLRIDTLGLHLSEAKDLLQKVQEVVIAERVSSCLVNQVACPHCHQARCHNDATPSFCGRSSARSTCAVRAGGTAPACLSRPARSVRWPRCCPNAPHPN
jgi:hypothetical protein